MQSRTNVFDLSLFTYLVNRVYTESVCVKYLVTPLSLHLPPSCPAGAFTEIRICVKDEHSLTFNQSWTSIVAAKCGMHQELQSLEQSDISVQCLFVYVVK